MKQFFLMYVWLIFETSSFPTSRSMIEQNRYNNILSLKQEKEVIGRFTILSEEEYVEESNFDGIKDCIFLSDTSSGWGNGKHPTTKLCLDFINENFKEGSSFLDYGTGSGILSILAAKMGASDVLAG
jgi:ribosomal protein L11 methylase PrmA